MTSNPRKEDLNRIGAVNLADLAEGPGKDSPLFYECRTALRELAHQGYFAPQTGGPGPYELSLGLEDKRLVIEIRDAQGRDLPMLVLSLKPYKRLIKDYFIILDSYNDLARSGDHARLEAIDMGRRGLHNEAADLIMSRLEGKIEMDHETARRFFTLICVLSEGRQLTHI